MNKAATSFKQPFSFATFVVRLSIRLAALIFATLLVTTYVSANPNTIKVCLMDTELFPLWRKPGNEEMSSPGINIELQRYVAQQIGHSIEWVRAPFPRCLVMLRQNQVDMLNVASYSPDREAYGRYPKIEGHIDPARSLKTDSYYAYVLLNTNVEFSDGDFHNLGDKPIAIEIGASIRTYLNEKNIPVYEVSRVSQAFGMLKLGRVSAVVTNQFNGLSYASDNILELPNEVRRRPYYLVISHGFYTHNPELSEEIWRVSGEVRDALYKKLLAEYTQYQSW
ncbi:transporter substrate-binding domain-containing protein [Alteromonas sp. ASW11-36]|uniref:Transporter substrate-binding domain-containing protein n=1 Tax=Alteromonas arenosi TaxID=3055817 RepID=A0ABT7SUJ2_9ALTE|nr:transporter substrate-binding domain-containing protein [Alteromonas sp. ASW11-36]MDM7859858.1 transporter substrate-binding domain-containing protein [Alteromonas sp. ASW11-36]